jgi:tyrosyl-tRNA synthetase
VTTLPEDLIRLHQYLTNQPDEILETLFKSFTFLELEEIQAVLADHNKNPDSKYGQTKLVSEMVHQITGDLDAVKSTLKYREYFTLNFEQLVT